MKNKDVMKYVKYGIISLILIFLVILIVLIYNNLFASKRNSRFDDTKNLELTSEEKNNIQNKSNELESIDNIKVYINSKIINFYVTLNEDIKFEDMEKFSNQLIELIDEDKLKVYDLQIFIESKNEESEVYPKIGYKHKSQEGFAF